MRAHTFRRFSDRYTRLVGAQAASLDPGAQPGYGADGTTISERLLHCIWFDQLLAPERLRTVDGTRVRVLAPGFWNCEAGPDFLNAELQFDTAAPVRGDVEIHVHARDWIGHGHNTDRRYDGTILHIVLEDAPAASTVRTDNGTAVPQASLSPALIDELDALRDRIQTEDYPYASTFNTGRCFKGGLTIDLDAFWDLVRLAGEARFLVKARRAAGVSDSWDQVCYAMLLQALGYKAFAGPCMQLARRVPYAQLCTLADAQPDEARQGIEAVLLGTAGLLPEADAHDSEYISGLQQRWNAVRSQLPEDTFAAGLWKAPNVRPANQPSRRIVAVAHLIANSLSSGLAETLRALVMRDAKLRTVWRGMEEWLTVDGTPFWQRRGSVSGATWSKPQRLVGATRARILLIDAVIPGLLGMARAHHDAPLETRLYDLVAAAPAQAPNAKLKLALYRTCGAPDAWPKPFRTALHGQGLLHVLGEWCIERPTCEGCGVHRVLAAGGGV